MTERLLVIGASYAGTQLAFSAREAGFAGEILLIGDEDRFPYHRPPLSKGYLQGKQAVTALPLRAEAAFKRAGIALRLGERAVAIDRERRQVVLSGGERLDYGRLGLATGARVRRLAVPGEGLAGVHYLRDMADADALAAAAAAGGTAVIVGGGFIGLEVAASLRALGLSVLVVEPLDRLLKRVVPALLSDWTRALHRRNGVDIRLATTVSEVLGEDGRVRGVRLGQGEEIACTLVVVGIGVEPNDGLAREAGLATDRGILVDANGLTSDPVIAAAGDCTLRPDPMAPESTVRVRIQSVQNATDQARAAGSTLAGKPTAQHGPPWFWSDQYDVKLQMVGLGAEDDGIVLRGDPAAGRFSLLHVRDGRLTAVDSVNAPQDHMAARKLLAHGPAPLPHGAADPAVRLEAASR